MQVGSQSRQPIFRRCLVQYYCFQLLQIAPGPHKHQVGEQSQTIQAAIRLTIINHYTSTTASRHLFSAGRRSEQSSQSLLHHTVPITTSILKYTQLHSTPLTDTRFHYMTTTLHCIPRNGITLHYTILQYIALHYLPVHSTTLHDTIPHYIQLHYATLTTSTTTTTMTTITTILHLHDST